MTKLFIPADRIGLHTFQPSIPGTFAAINALHKKNIEVFWHLGGLRLESTPLWPEGHFYQCGYSLGDSSAARDVLGERGIVYEAMPSLPEPRCKLRRIKSALYAGKGADILFAQPLMDVLQMGGFDYELLDDAAIRKGGLDAFDALVVPGSPDAGECYYYGLGDLGYDKIRSFIADRGHYLGICGGAYLPLTSYHAKNPYWLDIVEATDNEDLDYWRAGSGFVRCRVDDCGHAIFSSMALGSAPTLNLVFWEGPAIVVKGGNVRPLAHFESLLASGKDPLKPHWDMLDNAMAAEAVKTWYNCLTPELFERILANRCAFAEARYGKNKLLLFSPHPEMGNFGSGPWAESLSFLLIYNGLNYLSGQR